MNLYGFVGNRILTYIDILGRMPMFDDPLKQGIAQNAPSSGLTIKSSNNLQYLDTVLTRERVPSVTLGMPGDHRLIPHRIMFGSTVGATGVAACRGKNELVPWIGGIGRLNHAFDESGKGVEMEFASAVTIGLTSDTEISILPGSIYSVQCDKYTSAPNGKVVGGIQVIHLKVSLKRTASGTLQVKFPLPDSNFRPGARSIVPGIGSSWQIGQNVSETSLVFISACCKCEDAKGKFRPVDVPLVKLRGLGLDPSANLALE
jgi:hypothetical protein